MTDERRRFERVNVPDSARLHVLDAAGKKLGKLKMLGRGGMLFTCDTPFPSGSKQVFHICDDIEGIVRPVNTVVRYFSKEGVGCEFERLDTDAAVDLGVWIGRLYSTQK